MIFYCVEGYSKEKRRGMLKEEKRWRGEGRGKGVIFRWM